MSRYCVTAKTVFFLVAATTSALANGRTGLQLEDTLAIEYAADPQISPDGSKVVYVRRFSDVKTDKRYSNLWMVDFDGGAAQPLTSGNQTDASPRWSPDGRRLAFVSDREGSAQIYVRWMQTGQTARITNRVEPLEGISWSPDGSQIAFAGFVPSDSPKIARLPSPPEGAKWAEPARVIDRLTYRFNGAGFLDRGFWHLFTVSAEGGTPRQISSGDFQHGGPGFRSGEAVWAPDGKHLIAAANRRSDWELEPLDSEIYQFSVEDGSVRALTDRRGPDWAPAVSPDGARIAYVGFDDRHQGYQLRRLYVMNRDGSGSRAVSRQLDRSVRSPQWASDGSGVFALFDDEGDTKLGFFSLDGQVETITDDVGGTGSAYAGGEFSVSGNDRVAFTFGRADVLSDVGVAVRASSQVRRVTQLNRGLLEQRRLGEVEEIWYRSSLDQRRIQGWIIKPPNFDPSRKYPLILEIHGGPFANYGDRFDVEKQIWASAGYVVLYINPRGSTSYGEEFGNLIHHAYPGDDFYDLNSGVDELLSRGYIDSDNVFVTGGSGGGVLTAWMVGRTDRFRAAASVYPVINWYSWVLTTDISAFGVKYWFPGLPWDFPEHYEKRSLLSVVKNVKTPTMVLTGEQDWRTPMSESEQYFQALKLLGVESVLVRVPGEPHGIRRRPSHHMQKIAYIQGWFDIHRKKGEAPTPTEGR